MSTFFYSFVATGGRGGVTRSIARAGTAGRVTG